MADAIARLNAALSARHRVERHLGEGGIATVYLAEDFRHGRRVLKPGLTAVVGAERFLAEMRATAKRQHPHILPLHDSGEADRLHFYLMPRVKGESLRERLGRPHQLPVVEALHIVTPVAHALRAPSGCLHRDIEPATIPVHDGQPVVSDFGIALPVTTGGAGRLTETGPSLGYGAHVVGGRTILPPVCLENGGEVVAEKGLHSVSLAFASDRWFRKWRKPFPLRMSCRSLMRHLWRSLASSIRHPPNGCSSARKPVPVCVNVFMTGKLWAVEGVGESIALDQSRGGLIDEVKNP